MVFSKSSGRAPIFGWVRKNLDFLDGRPPLPEYSSPEKILGGELNVLHRELPLQIYISGGALFITCMSIRKCTKGVLISTFPYYIDICYTNYNSYLCTCMEDLEKIYNICICMVWVTYWGSFIQKYGGGWGVWLWWHIDWWF